MDKPLLAIIVPCFNEEEVMESTLRILSDVLKCAEEKGEISPASFIYAVDDGSTDKTFEIIRKFHEQYPDKIKGLSFTKNFGNQNAILAGILEVRKFGIDCCVTIDADLQQDETKIIDFVKKYKEGFDLVCGIRNDRNTDSKFKKYSALAFYKVMNLLGAKIRPNHSEYRLISRKTADNLALYRETNLFLRGIFSEITKNVAYINFDVKKRFAGSSKFSVRDLFSLAVKGITSFSTVPLRLVTYVGIAVSILSFLLCLNVIFETLNGVNTVPGWATIVCTVTFIGGVQILAIGIIGEYLGQLFTETKARPRYITDVELS